MLKQPQELWKTDLKYLFVWSIIIYEMPPFCAISKRIMEEVSFDGCRGLKI